MKILEVSSGNEYGFSEFEESEFNTPETIREIFEEAFSKERRRITFRSIYRHNEETGEEETDIEFRFIAYEFDYVDPNFIHYMNNTLIDHETRSFVSFVIVDEELSKKEKYYQVDNENKKFNRRIGRFTGTAQNGNFILEFKETNLFEDLVIFEAFNSKSLKEIKP